LPVLQWVLFAPFVFMNLDCVVEVRIMSVSGVLHKGLGPLLLPILACPLGTASHTAAVHVQHAHIRLT